MTRDEYVQICGRCTNRKFDTEQGMICGLTNKIASFENQCVDFRHDATANNPLPSYERIPTQEQLGAIPENVMNKFREQQDLGFAIAGGAAAALAGAIFWATVTVITNYQIGYMAVAVGLLVGFSVRYFGSGIDQYYGIVGAFFALAGCALGNLLSQLVFIADSESLGYFEVLTYVNMSLITTIFSETLHPMDLLFYGIAAYEGYKFSFRSFSEDDIKAATDGNATTPSFNKFRLPVVGALFLGSVALIFTLQRGYSGEKQYFYESGAVSSSGNIESGEEQGLWKAWWENGKLQSEGNYAAGKEDGEWKFYHESGQLFRAANFKMGLPHGKWTTYFDNGKISEEGNYELSRQTGEWILYAEDGTVTRKGSFKMGKPDGKWEYFQANGTPSMTGTYKDGAANGTWITWNEDGVKIEEKVFDGTIERILFHADNAGKAQVVDGSGLYQTYFANKNLSETGRVENSFRNGTWTFYYEDGTRKEEGEYRNNLYYLQNSWTPTGELMVKDGTGEHRLFYEDGSVYEAGEIKNGLRDGVWKMYRMGMDSLLQQSSFVKGVAEGPMISYYESGNIISEGMMKAGKQDGLWTWYFDGGNVESTVTFVNGKKEGIQETFNQESEILMTEEYKNGERVNVTIARLAETQ
jgi:antitoxin component YwqK of YwqJK toxin-antitoxin module